MTEASPSLIRPVAVRDAGFWRDLALEVVSINASGRNRRSNSDARLSAATSGLFAVADGVSSLPGSAGAAQRSLVYLAAEFRGRETRDAAALAKVVAHVNGRIFAEGRARRSGFEPGACTLDAILLSDDAIAAAHVGDGSIWIGGPGPLRQMTQPDRVLRPSARDPSRTVARLAAAVGAKPTLTPATMTLPLAPTGAALIASDGATDVATLAGNPWFRQEAATDAFAATLEDYAAAGRSDDLTVVAVRWRRSA